MKDPHHLDPQDWTLVIEDPGGYWQLEGYRQKWRLEVHHEEAQGGWRCIARAEGYSDGYHESFVAGKRDERKIAVQRCYEMADQRTPTSGE